MTSVRIAFLVSLLFAATTQVANAKPTYESDQLLINLSPRTPQQIAAFYEGRGFGEAMVEVLRQQCFITVFIENKTDDILWLDLDHWQFRNRNGTITRRDRQYWKARWQQMNIPLAHQSTFRWTLLPEQLGYLPDEREGGNIVLPRDALPFTIQARFDTGRERHGPPIHVTLDNLQCADTP